MSPGLRFFTGTLRRTMLVCSDFPERPELELSSAVASGVVFWSSSTAAGEPLKS